MRFNPAEQDIQQAITQAAAWLVQYGKGYNRSALYRALESERIKVSAYSNFAGWLNKREALIREEAAKIAETLEVEHAEA